MMSRRVAVVLVCLCVAIPALMYVRDLGASPPAPTPGQASSDAGLVLASIAPHCGSRCSIELLGKSTPHTWRVRLRTASWRGCYDLDPIAFGWAPTHGFDGLRTAPCTLS
jgi:hypothetical protein